MPHMRTHHYFRVSRRHPAGLCPRSLRFVLPRRRLPLRAALVPLLIGLASAALAGCGLHPGGQQIALLRAGQLIALNPDGSNPRTLASGGIVSFAWSPDHQRLVYREATGSAGDLAPTTTVGALEAAGGLVVTSINGGRGVRITPDASDLAWSDAWWNVQGNRLLYRQEFADVEADAAAPVYVLSQDDQPAGIARKPLYGAAGLPAVAPDGSQVAYIDASGTLRVGPPGQTGRQIATGALLTLPTTGRAGRVLWQPGQNRLLYVTSDGANTAIVLRDLQGGGARTIATVPALLDMAFAPDGTAVLLRTPEGFELWQAGPHPGRSFAFAERDAAALAWWSPDGRHLLVRDGAGIRLVDTGSGAVRTLLAYNTGESGTAIPAHARWQPAVGSPWSPDGTRIAFVGMAGATWQGKPLPAPHGATYGLYVADLSGGPPTLIDSGDDRAPGWSTLDPATALLAAS
ncbi:MAG TPA: LpqB family beta-propeller domain-containing protein [Ktedonobacterales bacterium]